MQVYFKWLIEIHDKSLFNFKLLKYLFYCLNHSLEQIFDESFNLMNLVVINY